ncbi:VOC family protein [Melissospora conviva]|uniref:VOC family protein n=1 Tax=Melissospora conviva TaxID=3388432 RepID=UPI003B7B2855
MQITGAAISINVADPAASAAFVTRHFGFTEVMSADGFVSLAHKDLGFNLVYLRTGLASLQPESLKQQSVAGLLVAFEVADIAAEYDRLRNDGVEITTELQTEPWGERFFQVTDPNGVILQLVQWMGKPGEQG